MLPCFSYTNYYGKIIILKLNMAMRLSSSLFFAIFAMCIIATRGETVCNLHNCYCTFCRRHGSANRYRNVLRHFIVYVNTKNNLSDTLCIDKVQTCIEMLVQNNCTDDIMIANCPQTCGLCKENSWSAKDSCPSQSIFENCK
jgi:hypothetical protein